MRTVYFLSVTTDLVIEQHEAKNGERGEVVKLGSDACDRAQIDSLIEEYFLEEVTDESKADDDEDDNNANYITDKTTILTFVRMITTQHGYASR